MEFITENIEIIVVVVGALLTVIGFIVAKTKNKIDDTIFGYVKNPIKNFFENIKAKNKNKEEDDSGENETSTK